MNKKIQEQIYYKKDIDKAFKLGFDSAVALFEESADLSHHKNRYLINKMKEYFIEKKIISSQNSLHNDF